MKKHVSQCLSGSDPDTQAALFLLPLLFILSSPARSALFLFLF